MRGRGYPTPAPSFAEGARECFRRFEGRKNHYNKEVGTNLTGLTARLTQLCVQHPSPVSREREGYPTPLASFTEGARACLRRFEIRKKTLKRRVRILSTCLARKLTKPSAHEAAAPLSDWREE